MSPVHKLTDLPTLANWLTNTLQVSTDRNYYHRRLEEELAIRGDILSELQCLVYQAHECTRQKLRKLTGIPSSLDPLEEVGTPGIDISIIKNFPRYLELKTLKGYFGEIMAAVVAENFNPFNEDWQVFAFPFQLHQMAYHALEKVRQEGGEAPTILGRFGDDMLAFCCDDQGVITHVLFCEAKCTARHEPKLISDAHHKSSDTKLIPVDCLQIVEILQDNVSANSDSEKRIDALRRLWFSTKNPTHERCDLVNYICGLPPVNEDTEIIPISSPHRDYTASRRLEAVEIHLHDVDGLIEEAYQVITQPKICTLDDAKLLNLWHEVILHMPRQKQSFLREKCCLLYLDRREAVIGVHYLSQYRKAQRQVANLKNAFQASNIFIPSEALRKIIINLKVTQRELASE